MFQNFKDHIGVSSNSHGDFVLCDVLVEKYVFNLTFLLLNLIQFFAICITVVVFIFEHSKSFIKNLKKFYFKEIDYKLLHVQKLVNEEV